MSSRSRPPPNTHRARRPDLSTVICGMVLCGMAGVAAACGSGPPLLRSATPQESYQGLCSMIAIQQVERETEPNIQDSSVQLMVSYNFEPRDLQPASASNVNFYFLVTRDRALDVRSQLARYTEVACEQILPSVTPTSPQVRLGLPPIEGVQEVRQAPGAADAPAVPVRPAGDPPAPPPPGLQQPDAPDP